MPRATVAAKMKGAAMSPPKPGSRILPAVVAILLPTSDSPTVAPILASSSVADSRLSCLP